ncbi:MAG: response regulator [Xanthobacteraceae bacterium]|nr:response regulator [Xanthobacteraceae bacterium]
MPKPHIISIVDDDPSVRDALLDLMNSLGLAAEAFASAEAFLASESIPSVSCLIADVRMPAMSGVELHGRLRSSGRSIPTILITAHPSEEVQASALKDGVVRYLTKPFSDGDLIAAIDAALAFREAC